MRKKRIWALVISGVRARILRGLEEETPPPSPPTELINKSRLNHLHAAFSDRPVRTTVPGQAYRRSVIERRKTAIRNDMEDFATYVCTFLDSHRLAGDFERLAVFGSAPMLGCLRHAMSPALRRTVFSEQARNLVHLSEAELRQTVRTTIAALPKDEPA